MELLPIIYWSLLSVGIVVLIVIIFSFISFKFRKKHGNIPSEEIKGIERDKKVKVTNPEKSQFEKKHHPKVQKISKLKRGSTTSSHEKSNNKEENDGLYKKPTRETLKKRVEILKKNFNEDSSKTKSSINDRTTFHSIKIESKKDGWN